MGLNRLMENPWLGRILLVVSLASTGAVFLLYSRIDALVNGSLYDYNLQFNSNWYNPYKSTTTKNPNTCLNCNKTFTRPLVTLNFVNGKPKMMNTCPYCNTPIENTNN